MPSSSPADPDQLEDADSLTLSLPSLILIAILSFLALRWVFSARTSSSASGDRGVASGRRRHNNNNGRQRVNPEAVEQIAQMFPQLGRRDIMWDLLRNGGSVAATTERVLVGEGLETPPPSFQPTLPPPPPTTTSTTPSTPKPTEPDLITRYGLRSKITEESSPLTADSSSDSKNNNNNTNLADPSSSPLSRKQGWSQNKVERQELLKRRREEMILNARRKMLEKGSSSGV